MVEACHLTKYYGNQPAVHDVSFTVAEGETVGFLGANGTGKTTTMRMLTGFLAPTSGTARIAGFDVQDAPLEARRRLGYLPENTPLYRDMRVREFLRYRARLKGLDGDARRAAVGEAMAAAHVTDVATRIIGQLSKGYRQRVGLADCLLGRPPLLILDEPTVGLDPNQVVETRALIQELGRDRTVFLSTHILHEVELTCARVIIIDKGRIVAEGSAEELCTQYAETRELTLQLVSDDDPREAIAALAGVKQIADAGRTPEGERCYRIQCSRGQDPRHTVAQLIAEKGWLLTELRLEPVRLEDIFARLTAQTPAAAPEPVAVND